MARKSKGQKGFLARLSRDEGGNTLALTAAAIIPILAMIGGAVDMSRLYLVRSRLQQACDAGALAGRRQMSNGSWSSAANTAAQNFFDTNFANGIYGTINRSRSFTESSQIVTGVASVVVPMSLMKFFGFGEQTVAVDCTAEMKIPNTDVMFVLDTTGSMGQKATSTDTVTKIQALRSAVTNFYNTLEGAKGPGTQIRYGFVPYSSNVNVGLLLQRDWMVDSAYYQTRKAHFTGYATTSTNWAYVSGVYGTSTSTKQNSCPSNTYSYSDSQSSSQTTNQDGTTTTVTVTTRTENGIKYSCSSTNKGYTVTAYQYTNYVSQKTDTTAPQYDWIYNKYPITVSGLKGTNADGTMAGGSITANVGTMSNHQPTAKTVAWDGCIEERLSVPTSSYGTVPSNANDLNIDMIPSAGNDDTRWKPALSGLVYGRSISTGMSGSWTSSAVETSSDFYSPGDSSPHSAGYDACPTSARKLDEIDSSTLSTYLNSLNPIGGTYHDIGMLWGGRLISPTGLFSSENSTTPNGGAISRHIIFMTDGDTQPNGLIYNAYGLEPLDLRRTINQPSNSDLTTLVNARLDYLCTAIKNKNITIWVVAFGTTLTSNLSSCASPGRAYQASSATQLNDAFSQIAAQISQLRLTS